MNQERITQSPSWSNLRGQMMKTAGRRSEDVAVEGVWVGAEADRGAAGLQPSHWDWVRGSGRREAVRVARSPETPRWSEGWLRERFIRHRGNADVVRQDLLAEQGWRSAGEHSSASCGPIVSR